MPTRFAKHVLKNSDIPSRPLPSSLLKGEAIVNTADGIVYFSGVTQSTSGWTAAGTGTTSTFFEVGSNLYDLKLRNKITQYSGISGAGLDGKILSGTSSGFVLVNANSIGNDTYVTGFTYTPTNNTITLTQTAGFPALTTTISAFSGISVNGLMSAFTVNAGSLSTPSATIGTLSLTGTIASYNNTTNLNGLFLSGTTSGFALAPISAITGVDTLVTGFTYTPTNNTFTIKQNNGVADLIASIASVSGLTVNGLMSAFTVNAGSLSTPSATIGTLSLTGTIASYNNTTNVSGQFLSGTTNGFALAPISAITGTYTSGFTYSPTTNTFTISQVGRADLLASINTVSGLTVTNLAANRLVYSTGSGLLTTGNAIFDGTNTTLPSTGSLIVGTGGLVVGSGGNPNAAGVGDVVIHGSLTVFGGSVSAFTSQLYVEDNNITINYNPTGNTTSTSIGSGFLIQDGNGVNGGDVNLDIRAMNSFTGLTASEIPNITEYTGSTGYTNRAWVTQLNDIVIRSTNPTTPNGVRVLAEFDVLDGGTY